jgi:hypothetical protein
VEIIQTVSDSNPTSQSMGIRSPGVMLPEHEVDSVPPSSAVVKNGRRHTSVLIACLHALQTDNITWTCVNEVKFCDGKILLDRRCTLYVWLFFPKIV